MTGKKRQRDKKTKSRDAAEGKASGLMDRMFQQTAQCGKANGPGKVNEKHSIKFHFYQPASAKID